MNNKEKDNNKSLTYSLKEDVSIRSGIFNLKNRIIKQRVTYKNNPFILKKNKSSIKTLLHVNSDTGKMRHFTPASQEWFNSVYTYDSNYTKLLPNTDRNIIDLLKSYFNLFVNPNTLKTKSMANRFRRLSANKIFVGKGELKHTSERIIMTLYIYNVEQFYLKSLIRKQTKSLYYPNEKLIKYINRDKDGKEIISYNRPFTLEEYLNLPDHQVFHQNYCFTLFWKEYIKLIGINKLKEIEKQEKNLKGEDRRNFVKFIDKSKAVFLEAFSNNIYDETTFNRLFHSLLSLVEKNGENTKKLFKFQAQVIKTKLFYDNIDKYMTIVKDNYLRTYRRSIYLLMINNNKLKKPFILELIRLMKNIYNKEIEFNLVNIFKLHLNTDIYTQAVSLKLRNRDNKLFKVLTRSLSKIKLPNVNRINEKYYKANRNEYLSNKIRNHYINTMFNLDNTNHDSLNSLLLGFFPSANNLEIEVNKRSFIIKRPISLFRYIIKTLKHMKLAGIRVEAKGRLTRRFTAAKSVFKVRWKGGLKNVDSSFKGLSTIMLRGNSKSNIDYSMLSSKNRNGAFGIKGWISSK